ncbi:hypothetical protein [Lutimonas sp.]|uniref:hypothetical protein n=1 Tax=Lutimonas sp. TaxID=1872403 RepID=UPI003D9AC4DF
MIQRFVVVFLLVFMGCVSLVSCSGSDTPTEAIENEYELDREVFQIQTDMYRVMGDNQGAIQQLRIREPLSNAETFDVIVISPKSSSGSLEGTYVYSQTGDVGTYNLEFVHALDNRGDSDWYTSGDDGERLEITYMGKEEGQDIYRVVISSFTLNYGYWDFLASKWVSSGQKAFKLSYEGIIEM